MVRGECDAQRIDPAALLEGLRCDPEDELHGVLGDGFGRDADRAREAQEVRAEPVEVPVEDVAYRRLQGALQPGPIGQRYRNVDVKELVSTSRPEKKPRRAPSPPSMMSSVKGISPERV